MRNNLVLQICLCCFTCKLTFVAMISPQTIEKITNRIDIIDVVGEFVKLKKRGVNYLGNCPFHNEKTPSFTVSPTKEIYKCFGCGRSGNTITFLMEHEKYSYVESLRWLANRYNVEIEETEMTDELKLFQQQSESLHIINSFAQKFFTIQLLDSEEGKNIALTYLEERGFSNETIEKFQLGYCPQGGRSFAEAALKNQFNKDLLVKSGLVVNRNEELFDNYRGRIIFPIHNATGKIIGFGARIIGKVDKSPKYINTPENDIYVKSKILYGSHFARHSIDKNNECLLVEGYTDVISLHQAGIDNAVASGGTSLTIDQLRLIKKYTNNLTIIYDGDAAGIKAALRGLDMALEESLDVKLVLIPDNEDPDSYVNKLGPDAFRKFVHENKKDFIFFQLDSLLIDSGNDVSKKNIAVNQIAETLSRIDNTKDFVKRQEYIRQCSSLLKIDESGLTALVNQFIRDKTSKKEKFPIVDDSKIFKSASVNGDEQRLDNTINLLLESQYQEREIVKRLIEYGGNSLDNGYKVSELIFEVFESFHLSDSQLKDICNKYKDLLRASQEVDSKSFLYNEQTEQNNFIAGLLYFPYELSNWDRKLNGYKIKFDLNINQVIDSAIAYYKLRKIKLMFAEVEEELKNKTDIESSRKNQSIYMDLKKIEIEITRLLGTVIIK